METEMDRLHWGLSLKGVSSLFRFLQRSWEYLEFPLATLTFLRGILKAFFIPGEKTVNSKKRKIIIKEKTWLGLAEGQLGLGTREKNISRVEAPERVKALVRTRVVSALATFHGSFALDKSKAVFKWGRLLPQKHRDYHPESSPSQVDGLPKVVQMAGTLYNFAFLTEDLRLFTFGENTDGCLGYQSNEHPRILMKKPSNEETRSFFPRSGSEAGIIMRKPSKEFGSFAGHESKGLPPLSRKASQSFKFEPNLLSTD